MQGVAVYIPRLRGHAAGARYGVWVRRGEGPLDEVSGERLAEGPLWPGTRAHAGHVCESHVGSGHLDEAVPDGHLCGWHLRHAHLYPEVVIVLTSPWLYFGRYRFLVQVTDAAGNVSSDATNVFDITINGSPRAASDFARSGYDVSGDRLTFSFTPSRDLAGCAL